MARQNGDITMPQHQQPNAHNIERGSENPCFYTTSDSKSSRTFLGGLPNLHGLHIRHFPDLHVKI
jgi:hypothetical protein